MFSSTLKIKEQSELIFSFLFILSKLYPFVIGGGVFGLNTIINVKKLFCLSHVLFGVGSASNAGSRKISSYLKLYKKHIMKVREDVEGREDNAANNYMQRSAPDVECKIIQKLRRKILREL